MDRQPVKEAIEALYKPVEDIVKTLAGPSAEQVGFGFQDAVIAWRLRRQVRLLRQVQEICDEAHIKLQAVPFPLLRSIMDKASLEQDDDLQNRWANLLANAADPEYKGLMSTAFPEILSQLSKEEAVFLEGFYADEGNKSAADVYFRVATTERMEDARKPSSGAPPSLSLTPFVPVDTTIQNYNISDVYRDNLKRLGLVDKTSIPLRTRIENRNLIKWVQTDFGRAFIEACSKPRITSRQASGQGIPAKAD